MKGESVVIAGYYGFGNAGDELILQSLIQAIRRKDRNASIFVLSRNPLQTQQQFDVHAVDRWRPWQWIRPLMTARRFVLGGGGLLQETTGSWNHFYYLGLIFAAKLFGCRTEVLAIGVDPVKGNLNRSWSRFVLNHWTDVLSVRDGISKQALEDCGVAGPIAIRQDLVFELELPRRSEPSCGIAFALSRGTSTSFPTVAVADLIDRLARDLLIPIDLLVFFPEQDVSLAQDIKQLSTGVRNVIMGDKLQDLLSCVPKYGLVVSTRYHALVLAAAANVSFIGWGPQPKVKALCQDREMLYWDFNDQWSPSEQFCELSELYKSKDKSVILATRIG